MKKQTKIIRLDEIDNIIFHLVNIEDIFHISVTKAETVMHKHSHSHAGGGSCPACRSKLDISVHHAYGPRHQKEQLRSDDLDFFINATPPNLNNEIFYTIEVKRAKDPGGYDNNDFYYNINQDSVDRLKEALI